MGLFQAGEKHGKDRVAEGTGLQYTGAAGEMSVMRTDLKRAKC